MEKKLFFFKTKIIPIFSCVFLICSRISSLFLLLHFGPKISISNHALQDNYTIARLQDEIPFQIFFLLGKQTNLTSSIPETKISVNSRAPVTVRLRFQAFSRWKKKEKTKQSKKHIKSVCSSPFDYLLLLPVNIFELQLIPASESIGFQTLFHACFGC